MSISREELGEHLSSLGFTKNESYVAYISVEDMMWGGLPDQWLRAVGNELGYDLCSVVEIFPSYPLCSLSIFILETPRNRIRGLYPRTRMQVAEAVVESIQELDILLKVTNSANQDSCKNGLQEMQKEKTDSS